MKPAIRLYAIVILLIFLITYGNESFSQSYADAPPCSMDVDKNFSVAEAIQALDRAANAVVLSTAKNELQNAAVQLEQVMNYGALKWNKCMTCDPYKSIDWTPDNSYVNVARRLINLSRIIYNRPDYNGYLGLLETIENNYQYVPYCGAYANNVSVDVVTDKWEFGRVSPKQPLCGHAGSGTNFELTKQKGNKGRGLISCHFNESFYWLINNELVFVDGNGWITSVLYQGNKDYWEGPYKGDPAAGITHYISREAKKSDPCDDPSWKGGTPPACQAYLVVPPYGGSCWANEGGKYWGIEGGNHWKYFVVGGSGLDEYDRCGKYLGTYVKEYTNISDDGKQMWGGYIRLADGSRGNNWYVVWQ